MLRTHAPAPWEQPEKCVTYVVRGCGFVCGFVGLVLCWVCVQYSTHMHVHVPNIQLPHTPDPHTPTPTPCHRMVPIAQQPNRPPAHSVSDDSVMDCCMCITRHTQYGPGIETRWGVCDVVYIIQYTIRIQYNLYLNPRAHA